MTEKECNDFIAAQKETKEKREKEKNDEIQNAKRIISEPEQPAKVLLKCAKILAKVNDGITWQDAERVFISENALTKKLKKHGSYTVSVFDNGEIILKFNKDIKQRYSVFRNSKLGKDIEDLI